MGVAVDGLWLGLTKDPLAMSLMSAAQGDMDVQPVKIHNKIYRFSLLPYPYKATILCFSNFVLFQQLLHVSVLYEPRHLFWALACWLAQYGYLIGVFTDHTQFMSSWCISLAFIKSNSFICLSQSFKLFLHCRYFFNFSCGVVLMVAY